MKIKISGSVIIASLICFLLLSSMSGCIMLNDTRPLSNDFDFSLHPERAVIVFGIRIEQDFYANRFSISLDEYDKSKQKITGNCWRFNRVTAIAQKSKNDTQYFAFDVPHGYYVISAFGLQPVPTSFGRADGYFIQSGKVSYVGDFVYVGGNKFFVKNNAIQAGEFIKKHFPLINAETINAEVIEVAAPGMFVCGP